MLIGIYYKNTDAPPNWGCYLLTYSPEISPDKNIFHIQKNVISCNPDGTISITPSWIIPWYYLQVKL